jgi:beta-N-acetylglucosaminidase
MKNSFHNAFSTDIQKWYTLEQVHHNNETYFVILKIQESKNISIEDINDFKELLNCNIVLRSNGFLYFCQQIQNAEIIEEQFTKNNK